MLAYRPLVRKLRVKLMEALARFVGMVLLFTGVCKVCGNGIAVYLSVRFAIRTA